MRARSSPPPPHGDVVLKKISTSRFDKARDQMLLIQNVHSHKAEGVCPLHELSHATALFQGRGQRVAGVLKNLAGRNLLHGRWGSRRACPH